jgi:thiol-disulfide isomerase/thioredoxin
MRPLVETETEAPVWIFKAAAALCLLFTGLAVALALRSPPTVEPSATLAFDRPQLVVFETESCVWCQRFREHIAPAYQASSLEGRAPLRYVHIDEQRTAGYRLAHRVVATPTFVLVDPQAREVGRLRGMPPGSDAFAKQVTQMLAKIRLPGAG